MRSWSFRIPGVAALLAASLLILSAPVARADWHGGWRGGGWHDGWHHGGWGWRGGGWGCCWRGGVFIGLPPVYVAPPAYYPPPPVYYPPPYYAPYAYGYRPY